MESSKNIKRPNSTMTGPYTCHKHQRVTIILDRMYTNNATKLPKPPWSL